MEDGDMGHREAAIRFWSSLALAAGLSGCTDPDMGTIRADRRAVEGQKSTSPDRTSPLANKARPRPGDNDTSPKSRWGEAKP